jgi:hypothetical protein
MPGSIADNFHEGSRAEYLAQYLFSGIGTSISVPHHEDTGIDLYCTMTEKLGRRARPIAYFTVQVKSSDSPWEFSDRESVQWLIEQPLPLYLCVVDKSELRFRLYHTFARFHIWSLAVPSLERLELVPGPCGNGTYTDWDGGQRIALGAPILEVTLVESLEKNRATRMREILKHWLNLDTINLARITTGTLSYVMPQSYETNSIPSGTASRTFGKGHVNVSEDELRSSFRNLHPALLWLSRVQMESGDSVGAALTAMLMRHGEPGDLDLFDVATKLSHMAGRPVPMYTSREELFRFIDNLIAGVRQRLKGPSGPAAEQVES